MSPRRSWLVDFDGFHLGDADTGVTGIARTFQPGLDVLKRAAAQQKKFVICHESTFWDGSNPIQVMTGDPVHEAKIQFAKEHRMVVWRIHDHWPRVEPEPVFMGLARKLGLTPYYDFTLVAGALLDSRNAVGGGSPAHSGRS